MKEEWDCLLSLSTSVENKRKRVHYKIVSSISSFQMQDSNSTSFSLSYDNQNVSKYCQMSPGERGGKSHLWLRTMAVAE
jgi:hypothetical protein